MSRYKIEMMILDDKCFLFCRYGPVQSVKHLPSKDGDVSGPSPVSAVTVAFMDIKSACKALQTQHKLDER